MPDQFFVGLGGCAEEAPAGAEVEANFVRDLFFAFIKPIFEHPADDPVDLALNLLHFIDTFLCIKDVSKAENIPLLLFIKFIRSVFMVEYYGGEEKSGKAK